MKKNIKWANKELPGLTHEDLLKITIADISRSENGRQTIGQNASAEGRKKAGQRNIETGHIKKLGEKHGPIVGKLWGKINGKKNAESGHMKSIQPLGCSIGGTISGNNKSKEEMKQLSKLGNEANQQKYGVRIIATNLITEESWEYISIRETERDLKIQAPIIRKILKGNQPKTRCGWTFEYKK